MLKKPSLSMVAFTSSPSVVMPDFPTLTTVRRKKSHSCSSFDHVMLSGCSQVAHTLLSQYEAPAPVFEGGLYSASWRVID